MEQTNLSYYDVDEETDFSPSLSNEGIQKRLVRSKKQVKALNGEVYALLETGHKASSAIELKNRLVVLDKYLTNFSDFLDERQEGSEKTEELLKDFSKTCDRLCKRVDKMNRLLSDDIAICQHEEVKSQYEEMKNTKDIIKIVTYVIGLPTLAANFSKLFFDEKSPLIQCIAVSSIFLGTWLAFPKETKKAWQTTKMFMNNKELSTKNSFLLYYAKTRTGEITRSLGTVAKKVCKQNNLRP